MRPASPSGVPAALLRSTGLDSPAGQYNFLQGGDPDLVPEESETVTFGIILQPRFAPRLSMTVDYFDIEITDTISTFGAENTLNACYFQADAESCAQDPPPPGQRLALARRRPRRGPEHEHRFAQHDGH